MAEEKHLKLLALLDQAGDSVTMWQVGESLGLNRSATETLAMDLFAEGILEVVNLSGKVRITDKGRGLLGGGGAADLPGLVEALEKAGSLGLSGAAAQDLAADLATLKAQLSRSRPLMPVVKSCLAALETTLAKSKDPAASGLAQMAAALRQ